MAHYAFINDENIVVEVIKGIDEDDLDTLPSGFTSWEEWYGNFRGMTCKRTSYNTIDGVHNDSNKTAFRGTFAGIGSIYIPSADIFIRPKPYDSWTLNDNNEWVPPIDYPSDYDTENYDWNEQAYQNDTADPKTLGWVIFGT